MRTSHKGLATVCLSGTLEEKLMAASRAGFDGVEVFESDLIGSPLSPPDIRELAAELDLAIDLSRSTPRGWTAQRCCGSRSPPT